MRENLLKRCGHGAVMMEIHQNMGISDKASTQLCLVWACWHRPLIPALTRQKFRVRLS